jgi:hypothetical protein
LISIISAIWERPALTDIFLDSLVRYKRDYGIDSAVAGSEGMITSNKCFNRGISYVETKNKPLSGKFNAAALKAVERFKPKALLILGSDDFVDDNLIKNYLRVIDEADVVGLLDCYFYHTGSKESAYWKGYTNFRKGETIGMARMVSVNAFNRLKGKLWPSNIDSGLDFNMMKRIKKKGLKQIVFNIEGMVAVDIKGQGNISAFGDYRENMTPISENILSTVPEFERIKTLV